MNYDYTIIIPHKNTPKLLDRCLNSIPERDDVQIIVIDDNSDTNKVDFKNFPGVHRKNVEIVFSKGSKGAGYARNIGLLKAKGKWLMFADADDYYSENLSELLDKYKSVSNIDIVYFNCGGESPEKNRCSAYNQMISAYFHGDKDAINKIKFNFWVPWNKIISSDLVKQYNLKFEEIPSGNDAKFSLLASYYSKHIAIESEIYYVSVIHTTGITLKQKSLQERLDSIKSMLRIWNFLEFVKVPFPEYYRNIISLRILIDIMIKYGLLGLTKYLKTYWFAKKEHEMYPEIK